MTRSERTYRAYGLTVRSSVPLPPLSESPVSDERPDVVVRCRRLERDESTGATCVYEDPTEAFSIYRTSRGYRGVHDGVGTVVVRDERRIDVYPVESADPASIARLVLGFGLCAAFRRRGRVVLHASAVAIGDAAVAFTGESGAGKSTAAAACYANGHEIVADDVVPIALDGVEATVTPGYPVLRLDPDTARTLDLPATDDTGKANVDVSTRFRREPLPLDTVYLLERGPTVSSRRRSPTESVFALLEASYSLYGDDDHESQAAHLRECSALASACSVRRLERPRSLERLGELVERVTSDVPYRHGTGE